MTHLKWTRSALKDFATSSDGRHTGFEKLVDKTNESMVSPGSFGHLPGIGSRCYSAYHNHVASCVEGIGEASQAMESISKGIRATLATYEKAEHVIEQRLKGIEKEIDHVIDRRVHRRRIRRRLKAKVHQKIDKLIDAAEDKVIDETPAPS